eukprot:7204853-Pyramimonas_sp.AAC.1
MQGIAAMTYGAVIAQPLPLWPLYVAYMPVRWYSCGVVQSWHGPSVPTPVPVVPEAAQRTVRQSINGGQEMPRTDPQR